MGQITTLPIQTVAAAKALVGLGNVDNTSDADKPVSNAVIALLASYRQSSQPIPLADLAQSGATVGQVLKWNGFDWAPGTDFVGEGGGGGGITTVFGRTGPDIVPEAGDYTFAQISQKPTTLSGYGITDATPNTHIGTGGTAHAAATSAVAGFMSASDKLKLDGVTNGATANSPDATLLDRSNHTGAQAIGTINGLQGALDGLAPRNNPTFTGTVAGITKAMVGLPNVDNTTDLAKPVSTAQAAAIAARNAGIQWQSGGTNLGTSATADTVNAGAGLTASRSGNVVTLASAAVPQNSLSPASSTVPPTVDAVNAGLAAKADQANVDASINALTASLNADLEQKFDGDDVASQAEAEAGTDNTKIMTPLGVAQQLAAKVPTMVSATAEIMAQSQFHACVANAVGSTSVSTLGMAQTLLDSSTAVAAAQVDGNYKRNHYKAAANALNRVAGFVQSNGCMRITGLAAETTVVLGFADANPADGSIFGGLYEGTGTPAWTTTNPSAITSCAFIGAGCDQGETTWKIMWRGNSGSVTKVDTAFTRVRHRPVMVYLRPNVDGSQVFVRVTQLSGVTGRVIGTPFEYTITTNIYTAGGFGKVAVRGSLAGVGADGATAFQAEMLFGNMFGGQLPVLNYADIDPEPVPVNRTIAADDVLVGTDVGATLTFNSATSKNLTLPTDAELGFSQVTAPLLFYIKDEGVPTIVAGSGVNIVNTPPAGVTEGKFLSLAPTGEPDTWAYP